MINKFNEITDSIVNFFAESLGKKLTILLFCIIAVLPWFYQPPVDVLGWCSYISQTVIQLIALGGPFKFIFINYDYNDIICHILMLLFKE